jgi:HEAT repeat protein
MKAAEALGAIGTKDCKAILINHVKDQSEEVAETCQIALDRIKYFESNR